MTTVRLPRRRIAFWLALALPFAFSCGTEVPTDPGSTTPPAPTGPTQLSFWLDGNAGAPVSVTVDGAYAGQLTSYFTSTPNCGQNGTLTITTTAGSHTVSASGGGKTWNATTTNAVSGQCSLFKFIVPAGGGGGNGNTNFTVPNTLFQAAQNATLQNQCAYRTEQFTVSSTRSFAFRFAANYAAQAAVIEPSQLAAFQSCAGFTGYGLFDRTFGVNFVTLNPGTYYVAIRNMQASPNKYGYELDYTIGSVLLNPENGYTFTPNDTYVNTARAINKGTRYVQPITIQAGFRYFLDGVNSGELECFIIPASEQSNFLNGSPFQHYSAYAGAGGFCPGLDELKLPVGDYAIAIRNNAATDASLVMTLERWRY